MVGLVGDFNDWQPGARTLRPRKDGKWSVIDATVRLQRVSADHGQSGHVAVGTVRALVPPPPTPPSGRTARVS